MYIKLTLILKTDSIVCLFNYRAVNCLLSCWVKPCNIPAPYLRSDSLAFCIHMMLTHCSRCICTKVSRFELCYLFHVERILDIDKWWRLEDCTTKKNIYSDWKSVFSVRSSFSWIFIMYKWIMPRVFPFGSRPKLMKSMKSWRLDVVGDCLLLNLLRKLVASTQGLVFQRSNWNLQDSATCWPSGHKTSDKFIELINMELIV